MPGDVIHLEPWLGMNDFCEYLGCGETWVKDRMREKMPHAMIAGRVKFRVSETEPWLEQHGHLQRRNSA